MFANKEGKTLLNDNQILHDALVMAVVTTFYQQQYIHNPNGGGSYAIGGQAQGLISTILQEPEVKQLIADVSKKIASDTKPLEERISERIEVEVTKQAEAAIANSNSDYNIGSTLRRQIEHQYEKAVIEAVQNSDVYKRHVEQAIGNLDNYDIKFNITVTVIPKP